MKNKMAAATGFWRRRRFLNVYPAGLQMNSCKESVDTEVIIDTISRLGALHHKLKLPQLWSEVAIIKALIYKHRNQHRKEKYFQGLIRVVKCLNRLKEIGIYDKMADVKNKFPRLSKRGFLVTQTLSNYPSIGLIISILGHLAGAAQLLLQVMSTCQETFQYSCAQMVRGYFLTFHLTCSSSLSRIWVLVRSLLRDIAECYDIIFPWLNHLADPGQIEKSEAKDLPKSIKTWLETVESSGHYTNYSKPQTPSKKVLTSGTLDKLFASTPRENPEESSPRLFTPETESQVPCDLGESFISDQSDEVSRSLKDSEAFIADENLILKRKLFSENTEIVGNLHNLAEDRFIRSDATHSVKRMTESITTEGFSVKQKTDVKACLKSGPGRFSYCKKIHIYSNKRWKLCLEKVRLKKLRQNARTFEDGRSKEKDFGTDSMEIQSNEGQKLVDVTSDNTTKKFCSSPNKLRLLKQRKNDAEVSGNFLTVEDFVQNQKSSLSGKFKENPLNSDSSHKMFESFKTEKGKETVEQAEFADEIDSIFNALIH